MKFTNLHDVELYLVMRGVKMDQHWEEQWRWNREMNKLKDTVNTINNKIFFISGIGATLGAIGGILLSKLF